MQKRKRVTAGATLAAGWTLFLAGATLVVTPACGGNCRTDLEDIQAKLDACEVPLDGTGGVFRAPYAFEPLPPDDQECKKKQKSIRDCEAQCIRPADCAAFRQSPQHDPNNSSHLALAADLEACLLSAETCKPLPDT